MNHHLNDILMEDYTYSPLSVEEEGQQIRIMKVHPGTTGPLECTLKHVSLENPPAYEAISYTWNNEKPSEPVVCDGSRLLVTPNLHAALLQLRHSTNIRTVWADAICINQVNDTEKAEQVLLMHTIFRQAAQVLIWLGKEGDDSHLAMSFIRESLERVDVSEPSMAKLYLSGSHYNGRKRHWAAVKKLFDRTWFTRVWVIQEVAVSSKATVICGNDELPWTAIALIALRSFANPSMQMLSMLARLTILAITHIQGNIKASHGVPVLDLLDMARRCSASDPKDKIYALLSLFSTVDRQHLSLVPDYSDTTTPFQVYQSFARRYLQRAGRGSGNLEFLRFAGQSEAVKEGKLPSWVPDWSLPALTFDTLLHGGSYQAALDSMAVVKFAQDIDLLGVSGHVCDRIGVLGSPMATIMGQTTDNHHDNFTRRQYSTLIEWEKLVKAHCSNRYPTGETWSRAFHHALRCGKMGLEEGEVLPLGEIDHMTWRMRSIRLLHYLHLDTFPSMIVWTKDLLQKAKPGIWGSNEDQEKYTATSADLLAASIGRIMVSKEGYIGLVPKESRTGDVIMLVKGCLVPLVMRKDVQTGMWRLVGGCYVHGIMRGERFKEEECEDIWLR